MDPIQLYFSGILAAAPELVILRAGAVGPAAALFKVVLGVVVGGGDVIVEGVLQGKGEIVNLMTMLRKTGFLGSNSLFSSENVRKSRFSVWCA